MSDVNQKSEWPEAVLKLIELTQKGEVEWKLYAVPEPPKSNNDEVIVKAFSADHLNQRLLLTRRVKRTATSSLYKLQFMDEADKIVYSAPDVESLKSLYEEVNLQVVNIRAYLDELLKQ